MKQAGNRVCRAAYPQTPWIVCSWVETDYAASKAWKGSRLHEDIDARRIFAEVAAGAVEQVDGASRAAVAFGAVDPDEQAAWRSLDAEADQIAEGQPR